MKRRAFALLIGLSTMFLMAVFAVMFARFAFQCVRFERLAFLNAQADLAVESAGAWLEKNSSTLASGERRSLPLDGILTAPMSGAVTIAHGGSDKSDEFSTEVVIELGALRAHRTVNWKLSANGQVRQAVSTGSTP